MAFCEEEKKAARKQGKTGVFDHLLDMPDLFRSLKVVVHQCPQKQM